MIAIIIFFLVFTIGYWLGAYVAFSAVRRYERLNKKNI